MISYTFIQILFCFVDHSGSKYLGNHPRVYVRQFQFPENQCIIFFDFWSLDQLVVETLGVASVRTSVRTPVRPFVRNAFSRKPLITFF